MNQTLIDSLYGSIEVDKATLLKGIENNRTRDNLLERQTVLNEKYNALLLYKDRLETTVKICRKFTDEFKLCRRDEVESRVENILAKVYPRENFGVYFDIETKYNKLLAKLKVGPRSQPIEKWRTPSTSNGGFVKQLISASIIFSICDMRGAGLLLLDEQFCSSDDKNSEKIPDILLCEEYTKNKQIVMIEHKPEVYAQLNKRVFKPYKDRDLGYITSIDVTEE